MTNESLLSARLYLHGIIAFSMLKIKAFPFEAESMTTNIFGWVLSKQWFCMIFAVSPVIGVSAMECFSQFYSVMYIIVIVIVIIATTATAFIIIWNWLQRNGTNMFRPNKGNPTFCPMSVNLTNRGTPDSHNNQVTVDLNVLHCCHQTVHQICVWLILDNWYISWQNIVAYKK